MQRRLVASLLVGAGLVLSSSAVNAVPEPPRDKLRVHSVFIEPERNPDGSCTLRGSGSVRWIKAPRKKGRNVVGHYLRLKTQIQTLAGTTVKKRRYKSRTFALPHKGLPISRSLPTSVQLTPALGDFRTRFTVKVVRDVRPGTDTTAWKVVRTSVWTVCWQGGDP